MRLKAPVRGIMFQKAPARGSALTVRRPGIVVAEWIGLFAVACCLAAEPAASQQNMNPFAGSFMPGAAGPYGSAAGAYVHLMQSFQTLVTNTPAMVNAVLAGGTPSPVAAASPMGPD